jgi:Predicted glycosyltransferase involved in capsule biosynthesis
MKVSVLVPFGADDSPAGKQRAKVWRYNLRRWDALRTQGLIDEVIVGVDWFFGHPSPSAFEPPPRTGDQLRLNPFSVSRALNDAAAHARGDVFLMFGADHVPDPAVVGWAREEIKRHPWVRLHDHVLYASEAATHLIVDGPFGGNLFQDAANWHRHPAPCPGVLAVTRSAWLAAGGMDERFAGWGYEDTEFLSRLSHAVPGGSMGPSGLPLRELFVPSNRDLRGENLTLFSKITTERGW